MVHPTIIRLRSTLHQQATSITRLHYRNAMLQLQIKRLNNVIADLKTRNEILKNKNQLLKVYVVAEGV
jgi:hypothetical protein